MHSATSPSHNQPLPEKQTVSWHAKPLSDADIAHIEATNLNWQDETQRIQDPNTGTWYTLLGPVGSLKVSPDQEVIIKVTQRVGGTKQVLDLQHAEMIGILEVA